MSTQFTNRQWRLPNEENKSKVSNYSMDFDSASSDYIDAGNNSSLNITSNITLSVWVKPTTAITSQNFAMFVAKGINSDYMLFSNSSTGTARMRLGSSFLIDSVSTISTNVWTHIVGTYDGSNLKIYLNGSLDNTVSQTGAIPSTSGSLQIGAANSANRFNGQIDAVSIYNYSLSSSQITNLYGSSSTGIGNPMAISGGGKPVAFYQLGDKSAFNSSSYLIPNSSLKDFVFDFIPNDYIDAGSLSLNSNTGTVSAWIKTSYTSDFQIIAAVDSSPYMQLQLRVLNTGVIRLILSYGSTFTTLNSTSLVNDGNWHNVTFTYSSSGMKIYIDGSLNVSNTVNVTPLTTATGNFLIGARSISGTLSKYFNGSMSNVQVFNTALPATGSNSVETLYNNGSPLTSMSGFTSLQGWWKLDASATYDGTNWSIPDSSSNSNTGTSSGMTQANLVQSDLSFTSGYSPYALDFDSASGDEIDIPTITLANDFTISAWVTNTVSGSGNDQLLSASSGFFVYSTAVRNGGANAGKMTYYNGSSLIAFTDVIRDDNWHHVSLTYNSSTTTLTGYTDGNQTYSATYDAGTNNQINKIGDNLYSHNWLGKISNLSIWNAALTSAQVTEIYNEGVPSNLNNHSAYSNLVSWWQLGSNTSWVDPYWIALDEKGTNNGQSQNVAAPNNMGESAIVDGVGSYANGLSSGMGGDEVIGDAPYSTANALSVNMDVLDRVTDTPS